MPTFFKDTYELLKLIITTVLMGAGAIAAFTVLVVGGTYALYMVAAIIVGLLGPAIGQPGVCFDA